MFVVWNEGGLRVPYVPGSIRSRKVQKISKSVPIERLNTHNPDLPLPGLQSTRTSPNPNPYQQQSGVPIDRQPAILAKQIMTSPVITLPVTALFSHAWDMISKKRFRHIPVISQQGKLAGILSDRDVLRATIERLTESDESVDSVPHVPIDKIMVRQVLSASPDTEIREIARLFFQERIGAMPVVNDHDELVGILTRSDILRTLVNNAPFELWV